LGLTSKAIGAVVAAAGWALWMLFRTTRRRKAAGINPSCSYGDVLFWCFGGLCFGIVVSYGWEAFHRPLLYLTIVAFAGALATATIGPVGKLSR
jgi:hypothetical protein